MFSSRFFSQPWMPRHHSSAAAILGCLVVRTCRTWRRFCDSHPVVSQLKVTDPRRLDQEFGTSRIARHENASVSAVEITAIFAEKHQGNIMLRS